MAAFPESSFVGPAGFRKDGRPWNRNEMELPEAEETDGAGTGERSFVFLFPIKVQWDTTIAARLVPNNNTYT